MRGCDRTERYRRTAPSAWRNPAQATHIASLFIASMPRGQPPLAPWHTPAGGWGWVMRALVVLAGVAPGTPPLGANATSRAPPCPNYALARRRCHVDGTGLPPSKSQALCGRLQVVRSQPPALMRHVQGLQVQYAHFSSPHALMQATPLALSLAMHEPLLSFSWFHATASSSVPTRAQLPGPGAGWCAAALCDRPGHQQRRQGGHVAARHVRPLRQRETGGQLAEELVLVEDAGSTTADLLHARRIWRI